MKIGDHSKYGRVAATATACDSTIFHTAVTFGDDESVIRFITFKDGTGEIYSIVEVDDDYSGKAHWVRGAARAAHHHRRPCY